MQYTKFNPDIINFLVIGYNNMNTSNKQLRGIIVPLVTPLLGQDTLDIDSLNRLIDHVIEGHVDGIFILGSTGEAPSLSRTLQKQIIEIACRYVDGRVPVQVGIIDTSLAQAVETARTAADNGAQSVVTGIPYYFPIGQDNLYEFTRQLAPESPLPVFLYNKPDCMKNVYEVDTLKKLLSVDNIIGIKDSGGDMSYFKQLLELKKIRPDWLVLMGIEQLLAEAVGQGADGGVTGGANLLPRLFADVYREAIQKSPALESLQKRVMDLAGNLYQPDYLTGLKYALSCKKLCSELTALPLGTAGPEQKKRIDHYLKNLIYP